MKKIIKSLYKIGALIVLIGMCIVELPTIHESYIFNKASSQVVRLTGIKNHEHGGTGFQIKAPSGQTFILTNRHVCVGVQVNGMLAANDPDDSDRWYNLQVKEISRTTDLCLVEGLPGKKGIPIASSVSLNETVAVVGHPLLQSTVLSKGTLYGYQTVQVMAGTNLSDEDCDGQGGKNQTIMGSFMGIPVPMVACVVEVYAGYTNVVIYPGNSGSPTVNIYGNVTGVAFASDNRTNHALIIPLSSIKDFLKDR